MYQSYRPFSKYLLIATALLLIHSASFSQKKYKFDYKILRCAGGCRTDKQNAFFKFISNWNNPVCLSGPTALLVTGLAQDNTILKKKALFGAETIASATAITFSLKFVIGRIRPFQYDTTFLAVVNAHNKAFPSGHTSEAFAMATAMSIAVPKWYVIVPAYAWASMIAYARVYLGVHYPTDVIGGAIVGAGSGYLMYELNNWLQKENNGNHPAKEITGLFVGLGTAFVLHKLNQWISDGKKRRAIEKPSF
jgi:membrane-associated phospholipid phosphatase